RGPPCRTPGRPAPASPPCHKSTADTAAAPEPDPQTPRANTATPQQAPPRPPASRKASRASGQCTGWTGLGRLGLNHRGTEAQRRRREMNRGARGERGEGKELSHRGTETQRRGLIRRFRRLTQI